MPVFGESRVQDQGGAALGVSLPPAMPFLPPTPSSLLIKIDLFFKVRLKVTFSVMLSVLNGSLLVSKSPFFMLLFWLAAQPGSQWLAVCTSASPHTACWDSGSAAGEVTSNLACASGQLTASSPWLQRCGIGFPKPQTELKAWRVWAAWEAELGFELRPVGPAQGGPAMSGAPGGGPGSTELGESIWGTQGTRGARFLQRHLLGIVWPCSQLSTSLTLSQHVRLDRLPLTSPCHR